LNENKALRDEIKVITENTLKKFGFEENDLLFACTVSLKDDREIQGLLQEAKTALDRACLGQPPDNKATLPEFLTPLLTLRILESFMRESLNKIKGFFLQMKQSGKNLSYNNPEILMGLHDLKLDEIKKDILK